jgi:hypothetical protein
MNANEMSKLADEVSKRLAMELLNYIKERLPSVAQRGDRHYQCEINSTITSSHFIQYVSSPLESAGFKISRSGYTLYINWD